MDWGFEKSTYTSYNWEAELEFAEDVENMEKKRQEKLFNLMDTFKKNIYEILPKLYHLGLRQMYIAHESVFEENSTEVTEILPNITPSNKNAEDIPGYPY